MSLQYIGTGRLGRNQSIGYTTAAAGSIANGAATGTQKVRILATTDSYIRTDSTTATTSDVYLPGLSAEYVTITAGQIVSAIGVAGAGTLFVTEIV